jgi:C1A family cysteine protease
LTQALTLHPVTVVVSVDINFIFYSSGILNTCGSTINHAIQLVGYYKSSSQSYYIGKNSWGTAWGQQGFVYIDANSKSGNLCSVC